jgi:small subunit ribosomal protein S16
MAVKIRLKRMGNRHRPFYRLVVADSRTRRDGGTLEDLGWYDPIKEPAKMSLKEESILKWMGQGAQLSETARSLLKRAGILAKFRGQEAEATVVSPEPEATVVSPEPEATVVSPEPEAAVASPEPEATVVSPEPEATVVSPEPEATVVSPEPEATVVSPEPEATVVSPEPPASDSAEPLQDQ